MSDLAATNCGCNNDCGCGCNNGCGCGNDCGCGNGTSLFGGSSCNCILWIIILMCCCGNNGCGNGCGCGNNDNCWIIVFCFFFAATTALAAVTAAEDVDADPAPFNKLQSADKKQRIISSAFVCFFLPVALFLSAYFPFYA